MGLFCQKELPDTPVQRPNLHKTDHKLTKITKFGERFVWIQQFGFIGLGLVYIHAFKFVGEKYLIKHVCRISPCDIHYYDAIMGAIASQFTSLKIVYSTVFSDAGQRKHQSCASLAFVWGIHLWPVNSPAQMASNTENVSIWWRHHVLVACHRACWYWGYQQKSSNMGRDQFGFGIDSVLLVWDRYMYGQSNLLGRGL